MKSIITTHKHTDFDALASVAAAKLIYPDAQVVLPRQLNPNVKLFLSLHRDIFDYPQVDQVDIDEVEHLVVVDTNAWRRLDRLDALRQKQGLSIDMWDHHPNDGDIEPSWKCCEQVGANITLLLRSIKEKRTLITPIHATLFLLGLYEDTGSLTFSSSCAEDAYAAGYLLDRKADLAVVRRFLSPAYGQKQKDVLFELLKTVDRKKINSYSIAMGKMEIQGHVDRLSLVVRMYMDIANVDAAFGLFENQKSKKCIVIGRANHEALDIGKIMHSLGGGGHASAGSALLKGVNAEVVEEMITDLIAGNQRASVQVSDLMSFPVTTAPVDMTMREAQIIMRQKGFMGMPVEKDGRLVGMLSRRDYKRLRKESQLDAPVKAFMSTALKTIHPGESPLRAARMMAKNDIGRLPVVDDGQIIGIVSRSDTMRYFYDLLPD